jgi:hypothetical protein
VLITSKITSLAAGSKGLSKNRSGQEIKQKILEIITKHQNHLWLFAIFKPKPQTFLPALFASYDNINEGQIDGPDTESGLVVDRNFLFSATPLFPL